VDPRNVFYSHHIQRRRRQDGKSCEI